MKRQFEDPDDQPLCSLVAERGIKTSKDFAEFMSALMADVVSNRIDGQTAQAACKAGNSLLLMAKMQIEYGAPKPMSLSEPTKKGLTDGGEESA
jgi:hypothetical protein